MTPILLFIVLTILSYLGVWIIRRYAEIPHGDKSPYYSNQADFSRLPLMGT
ncbi:MAG: hypothetical protein IPP66_23260 [Anaerolineales bacterium]|nr:hypothetical protein [Anaerolineales bacterium]